MNPVKIYDQIILEEEAFVILHEEMVRLNIVNAVLQTLYLHNIANLNFEGYVIVTHLMIDLATNEYPLSPKGEPIPNFIVINFN